MVAYHHERLHNIQSILVVHLTKPRRPPHLPTILLNISWASRQNHQASLSHLFPTPQRLASNQRSRPRSGPWKAMQRTWRAHPACLPRLTKASNRTELQVADHAYTTRKVDNGFGAVERCLRTIYPGNLAALFTV